VFGVPFSIVAGAFLIELLLISVRFTAEPNRQVQPLIATLILANAVYLCTTWYLLRHTTKISVPFIIGASIVFRLTSLPVSAPLTDDLYRYRWEAQVFNAGGNPYASRPIDPAWAHLREDVTWPRLGQKDVPAGYGPAWTLLAALTGTLVATPGQPLREVFLFKLPAILFEAGTLGLLLLWIRRATPAIPPDRILIYAWCPLPVWEFWASGHNDAPVLFCIVLALLLAERHRWTPSWIALALAVSLKLWPAILIPAWLWRSGRRHALPGLLLVPAIFGLFAWPFLTDLTWNARYMSGFVGGWRNNDSLFALILWSTGNREWPAKCLAFGLIGASALWFATRSAWPLSRTVLWTIVSLLLLSSNCHPWYLTWFVPMLVFEPATALLLWIALMPLNYAVWIDWVQLGVWNGSRPLRWVVYVPVLALAVWNVVRSNGGLFFRRRSSP